MEKQTFAAPLRPGASDVPPLCNRGRMLVGLDLLCLVLDEATTKTAGPSKQQSSKNNGGGGSELSLPASHLVGFLYAYTWFSQGSLWRNYNMSIPFFVCELKAVTPYNRGFFCGDTSITYPFVESEAIPDSVLISGGIIITGLTIALGECYRVRLGCVRSRAFVRNLYVSSLYKELGSFLFGCCVGQSLTNMAKLSVGRLRPHFLSVCNVTYASLGCTPGAYIPQVTCNQTDRMVEEARKSFFSGHASFAMYTLLYLAFYLQARLTWRGARLLRPLLQFFLVLLAVYTGLTRISDYRHHPTDVLTGFLQGALTAYWVAFHISSMFKNCRADLSPAVLSPAESPLSSQQTDC